MYNVIAGCAIIGVAIPIIILLHIIGYMINEINDD